MGNSTFCDLITNDIVTKQWLRNRVEGDLCTETIMISVNPPQFNIFGRPWRPECLALIELLALGLTLFSMLLGILSIVALMNGYKPRNHIGTSF